MKKVFMVTALAVTLGVQTTLAQSTSTTSTKKKSNSILGGILSSATKGSTLGDVLGSVTGLNKITAESLVGTWKYNEPGISFVSDNLLLSVGGEVAAAKIKSNLMTQYKKVGITSSNTVFTFNKNKTFKAKIDGKPLVGTWVLNESTQMLTLNTLLFNLNGYARENTNGIELTFESKKILTLFQTVAKFSGNATLSTIGDLSKNYDGMRVGFNLTK
ncbi:DUF4923 family protein [Prevotella bivia]|uniref:DUF4923 family protein n=1 Tax=Prevotella bivia TaxID=28125 RepID=UPI00077741C0|nr:DUF4923 family protein [Prevotella bivia]KXU59983.1 hypothetical protein HMPREF3218_0200235 [Prevotella bivia]